MSPFYFGPDERRLFGLFEPAASGPATGAALLCNPFAHEAIHAHRLYRVLAQRLTQAGFDVLRFDYFGTGDSAGDDPDGDLSGWAQDVVAAHEELAARSSSTRVAWMGARLGASVAARATQRATRPPERLVLWEPVVDGAAYLAELGVLHTTALELAYAGVDAAWRELPRAERECMGFELGVALTDDLRALTRATFPAPRTSRCEVICGAAAPALGVAAAWQASGLRVRTATPGDAFDWTTLNADVMLVPPETLARLVEALTAG